MSNKKNREDKGKKLARLQRRQNALKSSIQKAIETLNRVETRLVVTSDPMDSAKLEEDRDTQKAKIEKLESDLENSNQAIQLEGLDYYGMYLIDLIERNEEVFISRSCCLLTEEEATLRKIKRKYSLDDLEVAQIRHGVFAAYKKKGFSRRIQQILVATGIVVALATACTVTVAAISSVGAIVSRPSHGWIFLGTVDDSNLGAIGFPVSAPLSGSMPISKAVVPRRGEVVSVVIDVNLRTVADDTSEIIRIISGGQSVRIRELEYFFDPKDNVPNTKEVWAKIYVCSKDDC